MAGVIPVIYYSILLGLGLPGEWGSWGWGAEGGQKWEESFFRGCPSSVLTPETQNLRHQDTL